MRRLIDELAVDYDERALSLTLTEPRGRVVDHLRGPPDQAAAPSGRPDRGGDVDQRAADAWLTRALAAASGWAVPVRPAIRGGPCRSSSGTHARPGRRSRPDPVRSGQVRRCGAGQRRVPSSSGGACGGTKKDGPVPAPSAAVRRMLGVCPCSRSGASAGTTRTTSVRQSERMWSCRRRWLVRWRRGYAGGRFRTGQVATGAAAQR